MVIYSMYCCMKYCYRQMQRHFGAGLWLIDEDVMYCAKFPQLLHSTFGFLSL